VIEYKEKTGLLSGTLYLPAGYDKVKKENYRFNLGISSI
jgi:hypothetical protein